MKKMNRALMMLMAFVMVSAPACAEERQAISGSIQIKGSDTMVNLGQAWAEEFMAKNPEVSIAVTGGGSGTGIAAIINGTCDIAQASRAMKEQEKTLSKQKGHEVSEHEVAIDALAVVVHPDNPVTQLSVAQLSHIYTGKTTNWKDLGGKDEAILMLSRERNSGTHVYFLEHVVRQGNEKGPEEFAAKTLMLPSSQAIVEEVANSTGAIGYVGIGYVTEKQKKVAVGKTAEGPFVLPSIETALDKSYPVARPLLMYTKEPMTPSVKAFMDYVLSDEGQKIVEVMDFVPLRK